MPGDLQRNVGENIKKLRLGHGLSQEALADLFGVQRSHYGDIENGKENMSLQKTERLAESLGVDVMALLSATGNPPLPDPATLPQPKRLERPPGRRSAEGD